MAIRDFTGLQPELADFFHKGPRSKYVLPWEPMVSFPTTQLCFYRAKAV